MSWTPGRVEQLKTLAASGLTTREIAARLGFVSRNGVIGKLNRLGVVKAPAEPKKEPYKPRNLIVDVPQDIQIYVYESTAHGTPDPTAKLCQWPSGDCVPYTFCGAGAVEGKPYCEDHCRIAYRKPGEYR